MHTRTRRLAPLAALALATAPPALAAPPEDQPALGFSATELAALANGGAPLKFDRQAEGFWGQLSGKQVLPEPGPVAAWEDPTRKRTCQAEQDWRCPLAGPLSVFGRVGITSEEAGRQEKFTGRTGVACRVDAPLGAELTLRGGPSVSCADPLRPERTQAHTDLLVEVQGRLPLFWGVGVEYQGTAVPALTPLERDRLEQDVRLAVPF